MTFLFLFCCLQQQAKKYGKNFVCNFFFLLSNGMPFFAFVFFSLIQTNFSTTFHPPSVYCRSIPFVVVIVRIKPNIDIFQWKLWKIHYGIIWIWVDLYLKWGANGIRMRKIQQAIHVLCFSESVALHYYPETMFTFLISRHSLFSSCICIHFSYIETRNFSIVVWPFRWEWESI